MATIQHNIAIRAPLSDVHTAVSTISGLASWWTSTTDGSCAVGEHIHFHFGSHVTTVRVTEVTEHRVLWRIEVSNPDWVGTEIGFSLEDTADGAQLRFTHSNWAEQSDFFGHCNMKWAVFLLSLRDYVESGTGRPFPNDVAI